MKHLCCLYSSVVEKKCPKTDIVSIVNFWLRHKQREIYWKQHTYCWVDESNMWYMWFCCNHFMDPSIRSHNKISMPHCMNNIETRMCLFLLSHFTHCCHLFIYFFFFFIFNLKIYGQNRPTHHPSLIIPISIAIFSGIDWKIHRHTNKIDGNWWNRIRIQMRDEMEKIKTI